MMAVRPVPALASWALIASLTAVAVALTGCTTCHPHLDVRLCRPDSETCAPAPGDTVSDWDPELASVFPDVARLIAEVPLGKHLHADWTEEQERAFWRFWDVPLDAEDKQVFLRHDGGLYRIRVLSC